MDDAQPAEDTSPAPAPTDPVAAPVAAEPVAAPTSPVAAEPVAAEPVAAEGDTTPPDEEWTKPPRRTLLLLITPIILLMVAGTIATAFTPTLAAKHPLLLITLDARNRMLVLAREVDLVPFVVVAVLRRSLSDPLFYLLGRLYGDRSIRWLEKKGGQGALVSLSEKWFQKASYLMVFLFPGAIVCALAGVTKMRPAAFAVCNLGGTLASVIAVRIFSDAISSPVEALLGFFERNMVVTTSITVGLVVLSLVLGKVQGKLEAGLDELDDDNAPGGPRPGPVDRPRD